MLRKLPLLLVCISCLILSSCGVANVSVSYQSIRNERTDISETPSTAEILVVCSVSHDGDLNVFVKNLTEEIMLIDRTQSFYLDPNGTSTIYYDPTIKTETVTNISTQGSAASVNLGALGKALGVGGSVGQILNGVNVGGSSTNGVSVTNATYIVDQPSISIAPKGQTSMGRTFHIANIGRRFLRDFERLSGKEFIKTDFTSHDSYCKFGVCITYSTDGGKTYKKIVSNYYANSLMSVPVKEENKEFKVNDALRKIYSQNVDALNEKWFLLFFDRYYNSNPNFYPEDYHERKIYNSNILYDYQ